MVRLPLQVDPSPRHIGHSRLVLLRLRRATLHPHRLGGLPGVDGGTPHILSHFRHIIRGKLSGELESHDETLLVLLLADSMDQSGRHPQEVQPHLRGAGRGGGLRQ